MAVDTPAKIAILGAGPIGLEAALYARYLGYEVEVFGWQNVCERVLGWRDISMLTPFAENASTLGMKAITAHDSAYRFPAADALLTYGEWHERYLLPLSQTDLLADHIRRQMIVQSIGKVELAKADSPMGDLDRGNWDFRLFLMNLEKCGEESIVTADVVLDCGGRSTGFAGHGGLRAVGESMGNNPAIVHMIKSPADYAGKNILVVGNEICAAEVIHSLATLTPPARITWITRQHRDDATAAALPDVPKSDGAARSQLHGAVHQLVSQGIVNWSPGVWVEAIAVSEKQTVLVQFSGAREDRQEFDLIVSQSGYQLDWSITTELQLGICPITDAPRPFSQYLLKRPSPYSVEYPAPDPSALITSEPNYYVLGSKSFGRMPGFLYQHGLRQIRDVFTIIGDRANLDLYAQMK